MKILQICPRYAPVFGGVEEHVRNISERIAQNHDVTVFTTDPSGKLPSFEVINGVKIERFRSWAPGEAYFFSRDLRRQLNKRAGEFDILHVHNYSTFPVLYTSGAVRSTNRLVFTPHYHGTGHTFFRSLLHKPYRVFAKNIFKKASIVVCVSQYEKRLIEKDFVVKPDKLLVLPNGFCLKEFRNLLKHNLGHRTILSVCRLEKYKGIQHLIAILPLISDDIVLEIVGSGPFNKQLVKIACALGVEHRVSFFQDISREMLLQKYVDSDLFVLLSNHEAYGLTVGEALASGTPCIVAETSALTEWVDNKNCFGIQYPINIKRLSDLVMNVVGKKAEATNLLDWDEVTKVLVNTYEKIMLLL
jgi:glycosyltransferase involved in cell wall biosynthesis